MRPAADPWITDYFLCGASSYAVDRTWTARCSTSCRKGTNDAMTSRSALAIVSASILATFVVGCAASESTDEDVRVNAETSVTPQYSPPLTGGICPDPSVGSTEPAPYYQARATSVVQYLLGGNDPITPDEIIKYPACAEAHYCTTLLRDALQPKGYATLTPATGATVCGLPAAIYGINISQEMSFDQWNAIKSCGTYLDKCWGTGVSGFFYADPGQDRSRKVYIDPEPARLTSDLVGSTGATAAAVYSSSGSETKTLKWPGSYTASAFPPVAGTPCSTTDMLAGTETLKLIQASGSWRRCF